MDHVEAVLTRWEGPLPPPRDPVESAFAIAITNCAEEMRQALARARVQQSTGKRQVYADDPDYGQ